MNKNIFANLIFVAIALLSAVLFLCLITYDADDLAENRFPPRMEVHNWFGKAGAAVAQYSYFWLGAVSYILIFLGLGFSSLAFWKPKAKLPYRELLLAGAVFTFWMMVVLSFWGDTVQSNKMPSYGGMVGITIKSLIISYLGSASSSFVLIISLLILAWGIFAATEWYVHNIGKELTNQERMNDGRSREDAKRG